MSDRSDSSSEDYKCSVANGKDDDICRDFLRNVCRRGKRCKYRHPNSGEEGTEMSTSSKAEPTFCHDFQNTGCHRPTCKFLHCTRDEEEHYRQTGILPSRLQQPPHSNAGGNSHVGMNGSDQIPVCRDYLKGECKRGTKCKYRHMSSDFECDLPRSEILSRGEMRIHPSDLRSTNSHSFNSLSYINFEDNFDKYDRFDFSLARGSGANSPPGNLKRRRMDLAEYAGYEGRFSRGPSVRPVSYQYQVLEEENVALRRRVEELKKQVADLTATNEVLLEQNARLRVAKTSGVTTVQMPVSQTLTPTVTLGLGNMGQSPSLAGHLSTSLTQQIALNSDLATQHALQSAAQRMAREIQQQAVTAAPRGQGGPQSMSLNNSLASLGMPQNNMVAVSLPSLVSPAPQLQVSVGSMAQNLGTPSSALVSYPIMSQEMRCAVASSNMAH